MQERIQKHREVPERRTPETDAAELDQYQAEDGSVADATERADTLKAELDDLLDEIDDVLEVNAEDFVKNYVQKGGE